MIEQQQIINSIMIANCNKYFGHPSTSSSVSLTKSPASANNTAAAESLVKIMSNSVPLSGATDSLPTTLSNTIKAAASGMSSSVGVNSSGSATSATSPSASSNNNKMGSRRIFSPHFKILVLESYRNDSDCKGNQRATARKYGIHRRQIQKWLQCEAALRTSVSSSSSSSSSTSSSTSSPPTNPAAKAPVDPNNNNNNNGGAQQQPIKGRARLSTSASQPSHHHQLHHHQHHQQARHSVVGGEALESNAAVRLAADGAGVSETMTHQQQQQRLATHTRQNSMEFFSPTTLIINGPGGGAAADRKMNEAAAPIKPEFSSNAAILNHHQQEDAPHSLIAASLPPFISTIYGPAGLLAFPTSHHHHHHPRPFALDFLGHHLPSAIPIDLSMSGSERRHASPLVHLDDARVPVARELTTTTTSQGSSPLSPALDSAALDLSCPSSRKRKASSVAAPVEAAKPPKLFKPYLLDEDDEEEEEELKVVDEVEEESLKGDSFLDQDLPGLKDKLLGHRFEYPAAAALWSHHHNQYYPGSSPAYDNLYYGHENLTLYPSPRQYRYDSQSSLSHSTAASSPLHQPSRPASSETAFSSSFHPSSPASSEVRASPPVFATSLWAAEMKPLGAVF